MRTKTDKRQIEYVATDKLTPYARNSRTHSSEQVKQIAASIKEFGFTNPVLIDEGNGIIAGHGRVMAAEQLQLAEVPCIRLGYLSEIDKRAYIIADNRLAEYRNGWDLEMLETEISAIGKDPMWLDIDTLFDKEEAVADKEVDPALIFEQSVQMEPAAEFIVVICTPEEYEEAKETLGLQQVRRGGYKNGSSFDAIGWERAIKYTRLKDVIRSTK